jgi:hypothetical protein
MRASHGGAVVARRRIEQSPLTDDPPVPRGAVGSVEDDLTADDGLLVVDFGEPWGVVLVDPEELE